MEYIEEIIDNPDYLHMRCSGTWHHSMSQDTWRRIAEMLPRYPARCVLIDDTELEMEFSVSTNYENAVFVTGLLSAAGPRIAIVDNPENSEGNRFFENVCVNRGLNIRCFGDRQEALDWLLG